MKTKYLIAVVACILLASFALGSANLLHLARASENEVPSGRLIGLFITREPLDLFDYEQLLGDHWDTLARGGTVSEAEQAKYQGRLYATLTESGDGRKTYTFEGVDGIGYFTPQITDSVGTYWSSRSDEAISDGSIHFDSTDEGDIITMEGTLYVSTRSGAGVFYLNPVYQSSTGEVYAVSGEGMSFGGDLMDGMAMSHELKEEQRATLGDSTTLAGSSVKITVCYQNAPEKVSILQFGADNELLMQTDYAPGDLPDRLTAQVGAAYILVETFTRSGDGAAQVTRALYGPEDESLSAFFAREDGICIKQGCEIDWNP